VTHRLQYFLTVDDAARQHAAAVAAAAGLLFGMLLQWCGEPFDVSAYYAVAIVSSIFTLRVWLYCRKSGRKSTTAPVVDRRMVLRFATAIAVFLLIVLPVPKLETGVLDHMLRALTTGSSLTPQASEKIANSLHLAQQWGVPVPSATLVRVRDAIKSSAASATSGGALPTAANALEAYGQSRSQQQTTEMTEASAELAAGLELSGRIVTSPNGIDVASADAAIADFSRAIQLSDGDHILRARAFLARGYVYSLLLRLDQAYSDAKSAEALGSTDLFLILMLEGTSLATHTAQAADLREAARLLTLADEMEPPSDLVSAFQGLAPASLAEVYYNLGEFKKSSEAALRALALAPSAVRGSLYQVLSLCYLRSGAYEQAVKVAQEYASGVGDWRSIRWLQMVKEYPQSAQSTLDSLETIRQPLSLKRQ
jgi:tetratricopeptide (TPR) repeat protein